MASFLKITNILIIHSIVVKTSFLMIENFNGSWFLKIKEFDGSFLIRAFLIRAFLIERDCVSVKGDVMYKFKSKLCAGDLRLI